MIRAIMMCMVAAVASAGCLRSAAFRCLSDAECGASGTCEPVGYCSIPNLSCPGSERMFSDSAGPDLSNTCVPGDGPGRGPDAGVDAPADGPPVVGCPAGYAAVAGSSHRYKRLNSMSWDNAKDDCKQDSASAYLAIPDDAAELMNLVTVANPQFWIGIDDRVTEGMFVTQRAAAATFLPWRPGELDNDPAGDDCVAVISATEIATEGCGNGDKRLAVCECEP